MFWIVWILGVGLHTCTASSVAKIKQDVVEDIADTSVLSIMTKFAVNMGSFTERINILEEKMKELQREVSGTRNREIDLVVLKTKLTCIQNEMKELKVSHTKAPVESVDVSSQNENVSNNASAARHPPKTDKIMGGAVFVRWGRTTCPSTADIVYKGFAGGNHYSNKAGAGNMLCLSDQPIYANHTRETDDLRSRVYGTEYETNKQPAFGAYQNLDMPCVVCWSHQKHSSVMVPGRNQCFPGWTREFWGYLLGPHHGHASSQYICVDNDAEVITGSQDNDNGNVLYMVESMCGSLPCPPYKNGWELTCAVCTR